MIDILTLSPIPILWTNLVDLVSPMLYTKSQPGSGEENIVFLPYMGMVAILFNGVEPYEQC